MRAPRQGDERRTRDGGDGDISHTYIHTYLSGLELRFSQLFPKERPQDGVEGAGDGVLVDSSPRRKESGNEVDIGTGFRGCADGQADSVKSLGNDLFQHGRVGDRGLEKTSARALGEVLLGRMGLEAYTQSQTEP